MTDTLPMIVDYGLLVEENKKLREEIEILKNIEPETKPLPKTIFIDLDGCVFKHSGGKTVISDIIDKIYEQELLPGAIEKFNEWYAAGHNIVITTGRPESMREQTENQLKYRGLFFDQLIMGLKYFPRVVINDIKPDGTLTAIAHNLERNKGLEGLDI